VRQSVVTMESYLSLSTLVLWTALYDVLADGKHCFSRLHLRRLSNFKIVYTNSLLAAWVTLWVN
jgi:hypothetical protein